jgi:hypothetical protein
VTLLPSFGMIGAGEGKARRRTRSRPLHPRPSRKRGSHDVYADGTTASRRLAAPRVGTSPTVLPVMQGPASDGEGEAPHAPGREA